MAEAVITTGLDEIQEALGQVRQVAAPLVKNAVRLALEAVREQMAPYPPQPDRDRARPENGPSPYNTYVRGIGNFPRSAFTRNRQGLWVRKKKGAYEPGPKGGTVRRTSEELSKRWMMWVTDDGDAISGTLVNTASYSGLVMGHHPGASAGDDIPDQAPYHAATGWVSVDDAIPAAQQTIDALMDEVANKIVELLRS